MEAFEAIASVSNAGSLLVLSRIEHHLLFVIGVLLLIAAYHVPVEQRAVPSLVVSICLLFLGREEYLMATNSWQEINIYQGQFMELVRGVAAPMNFVFGMMHAIVSIGTFFGLSKSSNCSNGPLKRD